MTGNMINDMEKILFSREKIQAMVGELGAKITADYAGKELTLLCVLKGSCVFLSDLMRAIDLPVRLEFLRASSYGQAAVSSGRVDMSDLKSLKLAGKHVLIVEDILDSGITLSRLTEELWLEKPSSLAICTLFDKPEGRKTEISAEYSGTRVPNEFIVGYGLDFNELYRNLPFVAVLKREIYA